MIGAATLVALGAALASAGAPPPAAPDVHPYYLVLYRYPDKLAKRFDLTPFELAAWLTHDGGRHFDEISHGRLGIDVIPHPEVVTLSKTKAEFGAEGRVEKLRAQDVICQVERRDPCTPENRRIGPGGVDLSSRLRDGHLGLILMATGPGGARRSVKVHSALAAKLPVEVLIWGIDGSRGASASPGSGWRVGAEEIAHHLLRVGDYYREKRHERPFWTRPDGTMVHRDVATGWAKTQNSWVHPTAWDKRLRWAGSVADRRPFWRLGEQAVSVPLPGAGAARVDRDVLLRPAELTFGTLPAGEAQLVLIPFESDVAVDGPDRSDTRHSTEQHPFHGYMLSHRRRLGADEALTAEGVLVWLVRDTLTEPGHGALLHRKSRAVLISRDVANLKDAPLRPGDVFRDAARGIEVRIGDSPDPLTGLPVSVRRRAPTPPRLAVTALALDDRANGKGIARPPTDPLWLEAPKGFRVNVTVATDVPVKGARFALQAKAGGSRWTLIREGVLDLDAGRHDLVIPYPKVYRDPWSGTDKRAAITELVAASRTGGSPVAGPPLVLRAVVWHEGDPVGDDDTLTLDVPLKAGEP